MSSSGYGYGLAFAFLAVLAAVVLKLADRISWPWWLVLSPVWVPAGLSLLIAAWSLFSRSPKGRRR